MNKQDEYRIIHAYIRYGTIRSAVVETGLSKWAVTSFLKNKTPYLKTLKELMAEEGFKTCSTCKKAKYPEDFQKNKNRCKKCRSEIEVPRHREYIKKWASENKALKSRLDKEYRENNADKIKLYRKSERYKEIKAKFGKKYSNKIKNIPILKLMTTIKCSVSSSLRHNREAPYFRILGYSLKELRDRLESTFQPGMSWDNYGRGGWCIDHIRPIASFVLKNEDDIRMAWSLDNLQALWFNKNASKGSTYNGKIHRYLT